MKNSTNKILAGLLFSGALLVLGVIITLPQKVNAANYGSVADSYNYNFGSTADSYGYNFGTVADSYSYNYGSTADSYGYNYGSLFDSYDYNYGSIFDSYDYNYGSVADSYDYNYGSIADSYDYNTYLGYTDYYTEQVYDVYDVGYSYVPTYTAPSFYSAPISYSAPVGVAAPVRIAAPSYYTAPVGVSNSSTYTAPLFTTYPVGTSQPISNTTIDNSISGSYNTYDYSINDSFNNTYTNITNNPAPVYTPPPQYSATAVLQPAYYPTYQPTYYAPRYVALSQIPYTGFDGGAIGNTLYWIGLAGFALALSYLAVYYTPALFRVKQMVPTHVMEAPMQFARSVASSPMVSKPVRELRTKTGTMLKDSMTFAGSLNGEAPRIVVTRG